MSKTIRLLPLPNISPRFHLGLRLFKFHLTLELFPIVRVVGERNGEGGRVVLLRPDKSLFIYSSNLYPHCGHDRDCDDDDRVGAGTICALSGGAATRQQNRSHCSSSYGEDHHHR